MNMINRLKSKLISLLLISCISTGLFAKEGIWLPLLLKSLNEADMKSMGLKLSAEDIYSINKSSLKDAVISFGGFCTGEIISNEGLILTNHHCGYSRIQSHSSVENDYLTEGYWAKSNKEELSNPGLTATFIVRMEDVTQVVLQDIKETVSQKKKQTLIKQRIDSLTTIVTEGTHFDAYIRPFFYGNEYYMFITETFKDVRLVGAPPSSIGKFGGDTDNWMWPRHTGDFSIFRIYADSNNLPAEYSEDNVPYQPKHHFPISTKGIKKGDFTMVYGFPGRTQEYLSSYAIRQTKEVLNPAGIKIREEALNILNERMKNSDEIRIKYASKYASISNYWKKWIGENKGLQQTNAIGKKQELEQAFELSTKGVEEYNGLLSALEERYKAIEKYALGRNYFVEIPYRKIELPAFAYRFNSLIQGIEQEKEVKKESLDILKRRIKSFFKDFDLQTDRQLASQLFNRYMNDMPKEWIPKLLSAGGQEGDNAKLLKDIYEESSFINQEELLKWLDPLDKKKISKLKNDPAYMLMKQFWEIYRNKINPEYSKLNAEIDSLNGIYMKGLRTHVPDRYYPDANSTLRLAYGKIEGFEPGDAVTYTYFTTAKGIMEKYEPGHKDFDLPEKLVQLIENRDFGDYKDEQGDLPVCFIASNHTTGGNSGSPVLNGEGELIGLNFDRNWEGTMSDINYDISLCRNISVDIRYVLFVVDRFAKSEHIMKELTLIKEESKEEGHEN